MDQLIIQTLPLAERIKKALIQRKGELIGYLLLAGAYERAQWDILSKICKVLQLPEEKLPDIYLKACRWSHTLLGTDEYLVPIHFWMGTRYSLFARHV